MLRPLVLTVLLFGACLLSSSVAIVLGTAVFGHTGTGLVIALAAEVAIWLAGLIASVRLGKQAQAVNRFGLALPVVFLVSTLALAAPLAIATALSFDH